MQEVGKDQNGEFLLFLWVFGHFPSFSQVPELSEPVKDRVAWVSCSDIVEALLGAAGGEDVSLGSNASAVLFNSTKKFSHIKIMEYGACHANNVA